MRDAKAAQQLGPLEAGRKKRAVGSRPPLSAPLCAGVLRLCVTLAGVRAGRGRMRAGMERRAGLPPLKLAPPSRPLTGRCRPLAGFRKTAGLRAERLAESAPLEPFGLKLSSTVPCMRLPSDRLLAVSGLGFHSSP